MTVVQEKSLDRVIIDTTVMLKVIAHASQYKRMHGALRKLKSWAGHIHWEIIRQFEQLASAAEQIGFELLWKMERILTQNSKDKNKL